jgi:hypothetical protein
LAVELATAGPGQATGLTTRSAPRDGLALDAVRDSAAGACTCLLCCDEEAAATPSPPPPLAGDDAIASARAGRLALHVSWCSIKLSTL